MLEPFLAAGPRILGHRSTETAASSNPTPLQDKQFCATSMPATSSWSPPPVGERAADRFTPRTRSPSISVTPALDPLVEPIIARAADDPEAAESELLQLRICDPAMGSGAFLVQAARVLAVGLARIRATRQHGLVVPEMVQRRRACRSFASACTEST